MGDGRFGPLDHLAGVGVNDLNVGFGRCFILGANIAAFDQQGAIGVDADECTRLADLVRLEDHRAALEGFQRLFDLTQAGVDLVRQLVSLAIFGFKPVIFIAQSLAGGAFLFA